MATQARYAGAGYSWPIPFSYARLEDVGVNIAEASGLERRLLLGKDYLIQDGRVLRSLTDGQWICIYHDAAPERLAPEAAPVAIPAALAVQTLDAAPAAATTAGNASAATVAATSAQPATETVVLQQVDDGRLAALEARLAEYERKEAEALAAAAESERARQEQDFEAKGERLLARVTDQAELGCEAVCMAAEEAEERLRGESASLLVSIARAESAAQEALQAGELADDIAGKARAAVLEAEKAASDVASQASASIASQSESAVAQVQAAGGAAVAQVQAAAASAAQEAAIASRLAGQGWPTQGSLTQTADWPAGTTINLPEPLHYYPGRNSLQVALNGYTLSLGRNFQEVGSGASLSGSILSLLQTYRGDVWNFWIAPTNEAQAASEYAEQTGRSAQAAAASAFDAANALGETREIADRAVNEGAAKLNEITTQGAQAVRNISLCRDQALDGIQATAKSVRADCVQVWQVAEGNLKKLGQEQSEACRNLWRDAELGIAGARADAQEKAEAAERRAGLKAAAA